MVLIADDHTEFERNVHLESFLIHCRNVWDFLESKDNPRVDDDVLADHYISGWQPSEPLGRFTRVALNKQLAHISYDRIGYDEGSKPWNIDSMTRAVVGAYSQFLEDLPPDRRGWFGPPDDPADYDVDIEESS